MKTLPILLCLAAVCCPLFGALAQDTVTTTPVGYLSYALPATTEATTTYLSLPLTRASAFVGLAATVGANTLGATATGWTDDQFVQTPSHVLITSGAEAGRKLRILGNTASQLNVDVADGGTDATGLDTADFAVAVGDGFEIVADDTLGSFFGTTPDATILVGGPDTGTADQVGLWSGPQGTFEYYYFNTAVGHWVKADDASMADANGFVIAPGAALAVVRQPGRAAGQMVQTGAPPAIAPLLKMAGGGALQYYGSPFPVDIALGSLDLVTNWVKKKSLLKADTVSIYNAAHHKWKPYHELKNGNWLHGSTNPTVKNGLAIPAGSVLGFTKQASVAGADSFVQIALPYTP